MISQPDMQIEQSILWVIDRVGDRNINPFSINSMVYSVILNTDFNNSIYNDVEPTIPFAPLAEVVVVPDMAITEEEKHCCVCQEDRENTDICRLICMHTFCGDCVKNVMDRQKICPLCRAEISEIYVQNEENKLKIN